MMTNDDDHHQDNTDDVDGDDRYSNDNVFMMTW